METNRYYTGLKNRQMHKGCHFNWDLQRLPAEHELSLVLYVLCNLLISCLEAAQLWSFCCDIVGADRRPPF